MGWDALVPLRNITVAQYTVRSIHAEHEQWLGRWDFVVSDSRWYAASDTSLERRFLDCCEPAWSCPRWNANRCSRSQPHGSLGSGFHHPAIRTGTRPGANFEMGWYNMDFSA